MIPCRSKTTDVGAKKMSDMIMKLKENENVCKFCNVIEGLVLVTFPLAVPILIMWGASTW